MIHETEFPIRTFHTDAFGHVNNSRHLEMLEEARWRFAEQVGLLEMLADRKLGFIIVDMRIRFRAPVFEGETTRVRTTLIALGSASGEMQQLVYKENEEKVAVKAVFQFTLIDRTSGASVAIDAQIHELLERLLEPVGKKKAAT